MKYIGAHVSTDGGVSNAPIAASEINCRAFAFFLKNQKRWIGSEYSEFEKVQFKKNLEKSGILSKHVLPHAGYLLNLCSPKIEVRDKSIILLVDELSRAHELGLNMLNIHVGSHLNMITESDAIDLVIFNINYVLSNICNDVVVVLENSAGQGGSIGCRLEQLGKIVDGIDDKNRIGVCIDTCHAFVFGYDLNKNIFKFWSEFENEIGMKYLRGMHLNDSLTELGSRKDRHENLGMGHLNVSVFKNIVNDKDFDDIPLILETKDSSLWKDEIDFLYSLAC